MVVKATLATTSKANGTVPLGARLSKSQVAGHHIKCDELVGHRHNIPVIRGKFYAENTKLVPLHGVLEWSAWSVHAVEGGHQRVLVDSLQVQISYQNT